MENLINIFVRGAFIDNMILAYFLGMCSYLAVSKTVKTATGLGIAVIFVLMITIPVNYLIENYILKEGALAWLSPSSASRAAEPCSRLSCKDVAYSPSLRR